ncbi:MAG: hypothetical protein LBT86_04620 [Deltaproteobacteria bacterium]|jgi:hypothetical protein|nr:hypothetical protein [Deltaproteobacteria bacterium]
MATQNLTKKQAAQTAINQWLQSLTPAEVLQQFQEIISKHPKVLNDLTNKAKAFFGQPADLFDLLGWEMGKVILDPKKNVHYYGKYTDPPNYDQVLELVEKIATIGQDERLIPVLANFCEILIDQIMYFEEDGEWFDECEPVMETYVRILANSSLAESDKLYWAIMVLRNDGVGFGDPLIEYLMTKDHPVEAWNELATKIERLLPTSKLSYDNGLLWSWLVVALERAGSTRNVTSEMSPEAIKFYSSYVHNFGPFKRPIK